MSATWNASLYYVLPSTCTYLKHRQHARLYIHGFFFLLLFFLQRTYDKLKETDHAAAAYCDYLRDSEKQGSNDCDQHHGTAYLYLASYYLSKGPQFLDLAREYAQKCIEYPSVIVRLNDSESVEKSVFNDFIFYTTDAG